MSRTWETQSFGCIVGAIVLCFTALLIYLGAGMIDELILQRQAYDKIVACEAQRMEAHRKSLTTRVTCVPVNTRQDTATVNLNIR